MVSTYSWLREGEREKEKEENAYLSVIFIRIHISHINLTLLSVQILLSSLLSFQLFNSVHMAEQMAGISLYLALRLSSMLPSYLKLVLNSTNISL